MATKSFLTPETLEQARAKLSAPESPPNGDEKSAESLSAHDFSEWLGEKLADRLQAHPDWSAAMPTALGSWARGELCPKSDIDLLFCGSEERVSRLVTDVAREGLKLRYRMPADPEDWTVGVEPFDVLALLSAVPLVEGAKEPLARQLTLLKKRLKTFRRELLKAMRLERRARTDRYDSISNFLEPNLKYGPGGLRDLQQALSIRDLYPEKFETSEHAFEVLRYYKGFFLLVRHKLHLAGGAGDVLSAPEQKPIADWLGYGSTREFMREIQKGLSRVSFYADWVIEQALASRKRIEAVESRKLGTPAALFAALEEDASVLMQNRVRLAADDVFRGQRDADLDRKRGQALSRFIYPERPEAPLVALFRSRLIDHLVPEFKHVVGHVQHDQYHRFSVDAHLLQALRGLKRLHQKPSRAGKLAPAVRSLGKKEWEVLAFACLYHDIAKGREGDHSTNGSAIVASDLARFGRDQGFVSEVQWIVEQHLALSAAAFRANPHSPRTWQELGEKGVTGRRLAMLATFTVVDIIATNPEAWTPWKERLLADPVQQMEKPEAGNLIRVAKALQTHGAAGLEPLLESLDPFLVASVPSKILVEDMVALAKSSGRDLPPRITRGPRGKQLWIRFHSAEDRAGLFLGYVKTLSSAGLGIRHASISTDSRYGVYDWFEVKTSRSTAQISKLLQAAPQASSPKRVRFDSVDLTSVREDEWVVSFRGKDQSGALTEAARALFEEGVQIRWAKVHTWGRQIDDVFGVVPLETTPKALVEKLENRLTKD